MTEQRSELRPEDLRIGNWVCENDIFENPAWHHTVIGIGIKESDDIWLSNCDIFKASELYPIPLSEDWMKRFGLEKDNETYSWGILITLDKCDFMFEIEVFANEPGFYYRDKCHEIKTVHHLMNLFHSLTGADLKELNKSF